MIIGYACVLTFPSRGPVTTAESVFSSEGADASQALHQLDLHLETKLYPPPVRRKWLSRPRLVEALDRAAECPLTLIAAPAGYGKSTVVAQWLDTMTDRAVAWVDLDAADNDPVRLWLHVATALARAGCPIADDIGEFVSSNSNKIMANVLPKIINSLATLPRPIVMILDDFHFVRAGSCLEQIDFVIQHLPATAGMMIITRADPDLHVGRLRVAGKLAEIRADRLSFNAGEASAMLSAEGVRLSDTAQSVLMDRTEGWPAGLYLAALLLVGQDDPDSIVHRLSGDNRVIGDYLTEEVLSRHPTEVRTFITDISILERFSAPLCDYLLETTGSGNRLHDLERSNLFLMALDPERHWFRFHHLFAAVARSALQAEDPDRVAILHDRAADWFSRHGFTDEAVSHAIAGGSWARASLLVQANWIRFVDAGLAATVQGWMQALQAPESEAEPAALVTAAWMALATGDEASLNRLLLLLSDVHEDATLPDGARSVESAVAMIRGMSGFGGPVEMLGAATRAVELESDENSPWFAFANFALGHANYVSGDLDAAMSVLPKAAYSGAAFAIIKQFALSAMAMVQLELGNNDRSLQYALDAMEVVDTRSLRGMPQASMAFTTLGESRAAAGDMANALTTLEQGLTLRRKIPGLSPWPTIHHLLAMGRVLTAADERLRAEQLLDEAAQLMSRFPDGMEAMRVRLGAARSALRRRRSPSVIEPLTAREVDVLRLLQGPMNLAEVASELFLSRNTVKTHVQAVYRKLGASSRSEAVRIGRRHSLI
jgi:LuxR family transcriptional regulator, maltose regulon positive regulatory protein